MPDRFVQQVFVDFGAEHRVGQLHFADLLDYLNR
jgi:Ribonuclease G/E